MRIKTKERIPTKPGEVRPGGNGTPGANKIVPNTGGNNANRGARPGFVKSRPAIVAKVEPTEEEVKNQIRETLEKLQGKGGKSKAANIEEIKRYAPSKIR